MSFDVRPGTLSRPKTGNKPMREFRLRHGVSAHSCHSCGVDDWRQARKWLAILEIFTDNDALTFSVAATFRRSTNDRAAPQRLYSICPSNSLFDQSSFKSNSSVSWVPMADRIRLKQSLLRPGCQEARLPRSWHYNQSVLYRVVNLPITTKSDVTTTP